MKLLLTSPTGNAAAAASLTALAQQAATQTIEVPRLIYTAIAVILALAGVYLARLVTISDENKALGRAQSLSETGPMTWIGILIVCPMVLHFEIAIPWAALLGLGVGYSVKLLLTIIGAGTVSAARGMISGAAAALPPKFKVMPRLDAPPSSDPEGVKMLELLRRLDDDEQPTPPVIDTLDDGDDHR